MIIEKNTVRLITAVSVLILVSCESPSAVYNGAVLGPQSTPNATLRVLALGDAGSGEWQQTVADDLADRAVASPVDFVLYLGDNFYSAGVSSIADPLWGTAFTNVYDFGALPYFYAVAGNHDHRGSALSQVDYSYLNPVWRMPALSYAFSWTLGGGEQINFLGIDTTILVDGGMDTEAHLQWIKRRLEAVSGGRIIVFGHHPVYSAGSHGDTHVLVDWLLPLMSRHGVDLYLAGHDHDLEVRRPVDGVHFVVSGAGGRLRPITAESESLYAAEEPGGVIIDISATGFALTVRESDTSSDVAFGEVAW